MTRDDVKAVLAGKEKLTRKVAISLAEAVFAVLDECEVEPASKVAQSWELGFRTKARCIATRIEEIPLR